MTDVHPIIEAMALAISGAPFTSPASIRKARAALTAALNLSREPSNAMCCAGQDEIECGNPVASAYCAMHDKLREEVLDDVERG